MCRVFTLAIVVLQLLFGFPPSASAADIDVSMRFKTATTQPSASVANFVPEGTAADVPRVIVHFERKTIDGKVWPVLIKKMNGFQLMRSDGSWMSVYAPDATAIEFVAGKQQSGTELVQGQRYRLRGLPLNPEFVVPTGDAGQTAELHLRVDDETIAPQPAMQNQPAADLVKCSVNIDPAQLQTWESPSGLVAIVHCEQGSHALVNVAATGAFEVNVVKGQRVELAIMHRKNALSVLAYCTNIEPPTVMLPKDATFVWKAERARRVTLRREQLPDDLGSGEILAVHADQQAQLPLAWDTFDDTKLTCTLTVPEGQWVLKRVRRVEGRAVPVSIGTLIVHAKEHLYTPDKR